MSEPSKKTLETLSQQIGMLAGLLSQYQSQSQGQLSDVLQQVGGIKASTAETLKGLKQEVSSLHADFDSLLDVLQLFLDELGVQRNLREALGEQQRNGPADHDER